MSKTILVIDDCPEERDIFIQYLAFVGGNLLEAADGAEGLRIAREQRPDLILLDLSMPVMDGWETMRRLQWDPRVADIPVVAVTAHHLPPRAVDEAGFCGYLEKPLAPYCVLEEVERCLGPIHEGHDQKRMKDYDCTRVIGASDGAPADSGGVPVERPEIRRTPRPSDGLPREV